VHVLDRDRDGERALGLRLDELSGGKRDQRPDPLSARQDGFGDGVLEPAGPAAGCGNGVTQGAFEAAERGRGEPVECSPVRECRGAVFDRDPG
jgi:hypothetical protein